MEEIFFDLPSKNYLKNYGGSSIIISDTSEKFIIMSARNKNNHSELLIGSFKNNCISNLRPILINKNDDILKNSFGLSYPFCQTNKINNQRFLLLFFTQWYKENGFFKNRLCVGDFKKKNNSFYLENIKKIGGIFENAGALRICNLAENNQYKIFIPIFNSKNNFEYDIHFSKVNREININHLTIKKQPFYPLKLPFKRTSCFSEFIYKKRKYCIFCGRDDHEYSIYITNEFNSKNKLIIKKTFTHKGGLCYPFLDSLIEPNFFLASKGRYGLDGLIKISLDNI